MCNDFVISVSTFCKRPLYCLEVSVGWFWSLILPRITALNCNISSLSTSFLNMGTFFSPINNFSVSIAKIWLVFLIFLFKSLNWLFTKLAITFLSASPAVTEESFIDFNIFFCNSVTSILCPFALPQRNWYNRKLFFVRICSSY